ncbi:MAG: xanthine dehydrogenase family protein molybdopterin-binding subunit [Haliscomenobacter sp.]|nr:molybdopterin cofactor-binding domain-containing protein [Haliscomenobacter sp.]MBK9491692.1 xanthine dehydrogenase family protein molybdopterin-binding subunit [Haliscomenobacter sp.]
MCAFRDGLWAISRSPVNGSKPTLLNSDEIRKISGVIDLVTLGHGIGVVADTLEKALKVKAQLKIQWSTGAKAASHNSEQAYAEYTALVMDENRKGRSLEAKGDLNNALKDASKVYSATYKNSAWKYIISGTGDNLLASGAEMPFYTLPDLQIELRAIDHGMRTKHWRAVGHGPNKYAIEAFIDEVAHDQKKDPYQYRRHLMRNHPRALKVLETVAEMAGWGKKLPAGRAMGIAFAERSGSPGAGICEISLDRATGKIKVHHIWAAVDGGVIVQPDNAKAQTEGSLLMGLSSIFHESITIKNGEAQQSNFHDYPILRMEDVPETLEVKFIDSQEAPSGLGEAGLPFIGPAVANAFLALTGKALRHMPFTPEKVLAML